MSKKKHDEVDAKALIEQLREKEEHQKLMKMMELEQLDADKSQELSESLKSLVQEAKFETTEQELLSELERQLEIEQNQNHEQSLEDNVIKYDSPTQELDRPKVEYNSGGEYKSDEYHLTSADQQFKLNEGPLKTEADKIVEKATSVYKHG